MIPEQHAKTWKVIVFNATLVIFITLIIELFFRHSISEESLFWVEVIDIIAVIILGVDLANHYFKAKRKEDFVKENWLLILSFIPYLIFIKTVGILVIIKPALTGLARLVKIFFHIKPWLTGVARSIMIFFRIKKEKQEKKPF